MSQRRGILWAWFEHPAPGRLAVNQSSLELNHTGNAAVACAPHQKAAIRCALRRCVQFTPSQHRPACATGIDRCLPLTGCVSKRVVVKVGNKAKEALEAELHWWRASRSSSSFSCSNATGARAPRRARRKGKKKPYNESRFRLSLTSALLQHFGPTLAYGRLMGRDTTLFLVREHGVRLYHTV